MSTPEPRKQNIPNCNHCGEEMYEGSTSEQNKRVFFCPEKQYAGTLSNYDYERMGIYGGKKESKPEISESQLFLQQRRNHEIQMSWKKKYQGKFYGNLKR